MCSGGREKVGRVVVGGSERVGHVVVGGVRGWGVCGGRRERVRGWGVCVVGGRE